MRKLLHRQLHAIPIRWCAALNVLTLNFLAPFVLGAEQFGLATSLLAIPYVVQGFLEPVIMAVTIRALGGDRCDTARLGALSRHSLLVTCLAWCGAVCFIFRVPALVEANCTSPWVLAGLAFYLAAAVFNTHLTAIAYSGDALLRLSSMYLLSGVTQAVALVVLAPWGYFGMLLALCVGQIAVTIGFVRSPLIAQHLHRLRMGRSESFSCWTREYLPALSPRLTTLMLGNGLLLIASFSLGPIAIAQLKVNLSLINTLRFLLPISPELIQTTFGQRDAEASHERRFAYLFMAGAFVGASMLAVGLGFAAPYARTMLLGSLVQRMPIDLMFLGVPFFVLINPFSSYLYATHRNRLLVVGASVALVAFAVGCLAVAPEAGFVLGSIAYTACVVGGEMLLQRELAKPQAPPATSRAA